MVATIFSEFIERFSLPEAGAINEGVLKSTGLSGRDREAFLAAASASLFDEASACLMRVLILEFHAAKLKGRISGSSEEQRLGDFRKKIMTKSFDAHLGERYPGLDTRLRQVLRIRRSAIELMISRFIKDRDELSRFGDFCRSDVDAVHYGLGDPHAGGHTVTRIDFFSGSVMYKPRAMRLDIKLDEFLGAVFNDGVVGIGIPAVLDKGEYGWSSFVSHEYCADDNELADFHRNIGRLVALLHLLRGSDIHCDNLIASRSTPWVVDPECLFADVDNGGDFGKGATYAAASLKISRSVVRTGVLPFRSPLLAFRGLDLSVLGATAGQQPDTLAPRVVDSGDGGVRVEGTKITLDAPKSMPCAAPSAVAFWTHVVDGFMEANQRLFELDRRGELKGILNSFIGCEVREIIRPTQIYAELKHTLWHPASLHDKDKARQDAMLVLDRGAEALSLEERNKEIEEVFARDIPVFRSRIDARRVAAVLDHWRESDLGFQELIVRGTLAAGAMNHLDQERKGSAPFRVLGKADLSIGTDADTLRRKLAAHAVRQLLSLSVEGQHGTRTWIGIARSSNGWTVKPVDLDPYGGLGGIVFALAAYAREMACGRVEPVDGVLTALDGGLGALREMEQLSTLARGGGFDGLGAQLWVWQLLHCLTEKSLFLQYALEQAEKIVGQAGGENFENDLLTGEAGLIVPLLHLADQTTSSQWLDEAAAVARRLERSAIIDDRGARWKGSAFDEPIGGMAHGASGIAWSLSRLAMSRAGSADERERWGRLARQAFDFESSLFDERCGAWIDLRSGNRSECSNAWCHGGVGIGLVASDLYERTGSSVHRDTMRLATQSALNHGWHKGVTLCHGSLGMRELVARSVELDDRFDPSILRDGDRIILSEACRLLDGRDGMDIAQFVPGLMTGLSGTIVGLCRMHPDCDVPTPLLMEISPLLERRSWAVQSRSAGECAQS